MDTMIRYSRLLATDKSCWGQPCKFSRLHAYSQPYPRVLALTKL